MEYRPEIDPQPRLTGTPSSQLLCQQVANGGPRPQGNLDSSHNCQPGSEGGGVAKQQNCASTTF